MARPLRAVWFVCGRRLHALLATAIIGLTMLAAVRPAAAQVGSERYASIVIDARTGSLLSAANADEPRYPASLTKMMTIYMLFEALRDRRVSLTQAVPISGHAAAMNPSKLGLLPGTFITVQQALLGLVTKSANDAAAALGEMMGGDEERFAQMMTMRARALGMTHTVFRNASGWPDPDQVTTARDLAVLARHLVVDFPDEYRYFSVPSFVWHGRTILNHDRMLQSYPGADGIKTGYTDASGCNLVTSAVRGNVRLIGVVMGTVNGVERDGHMALLLDAGFEGSGVPVRSGEPHYPLLVAQAAALPAAFTAVSEPIPHTRAFRVRGARLQRVYSPLPAPPTRHAVQQHARQGIAIPPLPPVSPRMTTSRTTARQHLHG